MRTQLGRPARIATAVVIALLVLPATVMPAYGLSHAIFQRSSPATSATDHGQVVDAAAQAGLSITIAAVEGSSEPDAIAIQATPSNAAAVSQIYFYIDNTFERTDLAAPYCLGGNSNGLCKPFDTSELTDGSHTVTVYMSYNRGSLESKATFSVANGGTAVAPLATSPIATVGDPSATADRPPTYPPYVGLNVYELASDPGVNLGCGASFNGRWASFFSSLPAGTVVRFWATQQMATSAAHPQQLDWTALNSVFNTAAAYHVRLIPVLGNEWTDCDGSRAVQKDLSWFQGGYTSNNDEGPMSYLAWVRSMVARYARSRATYLWEPMNEAQAANIGGSCAESSAAQALRSFFDRVGDTIHSIDPAHQVESGLLGEGNCGTAGGDYAYVGASPGIDVLTYHDYYPPDQVEGGDQWNGIAMRIAQAAALDKPILVGEDGILAGTGCGETLNQRAISFQARGRSQFAAGAIGMLMWNLGKVAIKLHLRHRARRSVLATPSWTRLSTAIPHMKHRNKQRRPLVSVTSNVPGAFAICVSLDGE